MSAPAASITAAAAVSSDSASSGAWNDLISSSLESSLQERGGFESGKVTRLARQQLIKHFNNTITCIVNQLQQQLLAESRPSTDEMLRSALTTVCPQLPTDEQTLLGHFFGGGWKQEASDKSARLANILFGSSENDTTADVSKRLAQWIDYVLSEIWQTALDAARDNQSLVVSSRFLQYLDSEVKAALYGESSARIDSWAEWKDYLRLNAWNAEKQAANAPATEAIIAAFASAYAQATPNTILPVGSVRLLRVHGPTAYPWFHQEYCPGGAKMEEKEGASSSSGRPQSGDDEDDGDAGMDDQEEEEQSSVDAPFYFYDIELRDSNNVAFQFRLQFAQSREESRSYSGGVLAFLPSEAQMKAEEKSQSEQNEDEQEGEEEALPQQAGGYFVLETEFNTFTFSFALPKQFKKPRGEEGNQELEGGGAAAPLPQIQVLTEKGVKQVYRAEMEDPFIGGAAATAWLHVLSVLLSLPLPKPGPFQS